MRRYLEDQQRILNGHALIEFTDLDFLDLIKLVNYVRGLRKEERRRIHSLQRCDFEDDKYLQPVLENDAVLYSLEDIVNDSQSEQNEYSARVTVDDEEEIRSLGPEAISLRLKSNREQGEETQQFLLKSRQQLGLARKALEKANDRADGLQNELEAVSIEQGTLIARTGSDNDQFDDPYSGKSPSLSISMFPSNKTSNPPSNAPRQSPHRGLPRLYPGQ